MSLLCIYTCLECRLCLNLHVPFLLAAIYIKSSSDLYSINSSIITARVPGALDFMTIQCLQYLIRNQYNRQRQYTHGPQGVCSHTDGDVILIEPHPSQVVVYHWFNSSGSGSDLQANRMTSLEAVASYGRLSCSFGRSTVHYTKTKYVCKSLCTACKILERTIQVLVVYSNVLYRPRKTCD